MKKFLFLFLFVTAFLKLEAEIPDTVWTRSISEGCYYAQFSSTGDTIMNTAGGKIQLRETATGNLIKEWVGLDGADIRTAYWSKSGNWIASGGNNRNIVLLNLKSGEIKRFSLDSIISHTQITYCVAISNDEKYISAYIDNSGDFGFHTVGLYIWELQNGTLIKTLNDIGYRMRFSSDGRYFAISNHPKENHATWTDLYDAKSLLKIGNFGNETESQFDITDIKFNSDCSLMATSAEDGTVKIWDVEKRSLVNMISTPNIRVLCVSFYGNTVNLIVGNENIPTITSINVFDYKQNIKIYPYNSLEYGWIKNLDFLKGLILFQAGSGIGLLTDFNKLDVATNDMNIDSIIYPNPSTGILKINLIKPTLNGQDYQITNIDGVIVLRGTEICNDFPCTISIDVSALSSGMYFVQMNRNQFSQTFKFVKE